MLVCNAMQQIAAQQAAMKPQETTAEPEWRIAKRAAQQQQQQQQANK
jgi:hypothetical protein